MAKCKSCKTNIPEGTEYCKDCQDKVGAKANESYLDSLLNSVKNNPSAENIYKKKNNTSDSNPDKDTEPVQKKGSEQALATRQRRTPEPVSDLDEDDLYRVDLSDLEDFESFRFEDDLADIDTDFVISDEDLFGGSLSGILDDEDYTEDVPDFQAEIDKVVVDAYADEQQAERYIEDEVSIAESDAEAIRSLNDEDSPEQESFLDLITSEAEGNEPEKERLEAYSTEEPNNIKDPVVAANEEPGDEYSELSEDTDLDLDLDELLNSLDNPSLEATVEQNMANPDEDLFNLFGVEEFEKQLSSIEDEEDQGNDFEPIEADHDDFLSLLGQVSDEDSAAEDIRAISDMLSGNATPTRDNTMPSNVGEVFSDALKAVSSLNDYEQNEEEILGSVPTKASKKGNKGKKEKEQKETSKGKEKKEKSGLSLFQRLFGNIKNDKTAAKFEEEQRKAAEPKAEKTKKAKGKAKKDATSADEDEDGTQEQKGSKNKAAKKADKKDKAEKKKKTKEVIEVIDEIEEDPGRINRVGASIVFFFFGIIAVILILGTNMVTYTLSIQHATNYFNHRKYTQAYNEVYGVDIKDEDIGLFDKIQTVMFVNKQLNSYNNYYALKQYPEALDSLLKGLSRYDKYIELATMLGIESDLDYVREQILAELNNVFHLTEEEAVRLLSYDNMEDYSLAVYDIVLENMNY